MIKNMHIREDYRLWYPVPKNRVKTMCNVKTTPNTAGIPGVDRMQPPGMWKSGEPGWCLKCCDAALKQMTEIVQMKIDDVLYDDFYLPAINVCAHQLMVAEKANVQI